MENILAKARELAALIKESEECRAFQKARDEVFADGAAKKMVLDYQKMQLAAQAAMMTGAEPDAALLDKIKKVGEVLAFNPQVAEYFALEYKFHTLVSALYKIIGDAAGVGQDLFEQ